MGEMCVMDERGDLKVIWDKHNPDEVQAARRQFDELKKKGYMAFSVDKSGEKGKKIEEFDEDAEKLILTPPIRGG